MHRFVHLLDAHPDVRMAGEIANAHPCKHIAQEKLQKADEYLRHRRELVRGFKLRNFWANDVATTEMRQLMVGFKVYGSV